MLKLSGSWLVTMLVGASLAAAQTPPAPPAGSGTGGPVGPSVSTPREAIGAVPPGTPSATSVQGQGARNQTGQEVIGNTATPPSAVPGNTGGQETGTR